jgi:hypothetical protein
MTEPHAQERAAGSTSVARNNKACGSVRPSVLAVQIDRQLELGRLLNGQIVGASAAQDLVDDTCGRAEVHAYDEL